METLQGPVSFSEWKSGKSHFYILGDHHEKMEGTGAGKVHVQDLIREVLQEAPQETLRLYIETACLVPGIQEENPRLEESNKSYIDELVEEFQTCFALNRESCPWANIETIALDFRLVYENPAVHILDVAGLFGLGRGSFEILESAEFLEALEETLEILELLREESVDLVEVMTRLYDQEATIEQARDRLMASSLQKVDKHLDTHIANQIEDGRFGSYCLETIIGDLQELFEGVETLERANELLVGFMFASNLAMDAHTLYCLAGVLDQNHKRSLFYVGRLHAEFIEDYLHKNGISCLRRQEGPHQEMSLDNIGYPWFRSL